MCPDDPAAMMAEHEAKKEPHGNGLTQNSGTDAAPVIPLAAQSFYHGRYKTATMPLNPRQIRQAHPFGARQDKKKDCHETTEPR